MLIYIKQDVTLFFFERLVWAHNQEDKQRNEDLKWLLEEERTGLKANQRPADSIFVCFQAFPANWNIQLELFLQECLVVCKTPSFICAASYYFFLSRKQTANFVLSGNTNPFLGKTFRVFIHKSLLEKVVGMASACSQQMGLWGPFLHESCILQGLLFPQGKPGQISTIPGDVFWLRRLVPTSGNPSLFS